MTTKPGERDTVIRQLVAGAEYLKSAGCRSYVVCEAEEDTIVVLEVWESKRHHDDSLQLPEARAAIERALPLLTGEFSGRELVVVGGLGV